MSRALTMLRAALAGLVVVVVVGLATPGVLGTVTVALWTHRATFDEHGLTRLGLFLLLAVAWAAWLRIVVGLCLDVAAGVRHHGIPEHSVGVRGHLAGWVVGLALVVLPGSVTGVGLAGAATAISGVSASLPSPAEAAARASFLGTSSSPPPSSSSPSPNHLVSTAVPTANYTVASGDCLSTIALRFYGDDGAWNEIWAANANRMMDDGLRFVDPNLIYAGWVLVLPGLPAAASSDGPSSTSPGPVNPTSTTPAATPTPAAGVVPAPGHDPSPANGQRDQSPQPAPKSAAPVPSHYGISSTTPIPAAPRTRGGRWNSGALGETGSLPATTNPTETSGIHVAHPPSTAVVRWVPESAALGISALVAAAYLRRIRRRRTQARAVRGDDEIVSDPEPAAVMLEARLAPFADAPVLEWLELANRHLTASLRGEGKAEEAPGIRLVLVGPGGVDMLLDAPVDWAPGSFTLADDGTTWRLDSGVDLEALWLSARGDLAWLPLLVPVGDDASGTVLVHLGPGEMVSLEGPEARSMLAAWVEAAKSWPWAEQIAVARDAETAEGLASLFDGMDTVDERATVFYTGEPRDLSGATSTVAASVTSSPTVAIASVTVTTEAATIEPFGITVRPCLLAPASEDGLATIDEPRLIRVTAEDVERGDTTEESGGVEGRQSLTEVTHPGSIEVHLLTFTPQIVGLSEPLPTNMAIRITELVAWIGLQGKKGTTSASMLDHCIVGATTTKTLYNIVSAARAALGTDSEGAPRLITDRTTGVYRLADEVTVDVLRFVRMAERGTASVDPQTAADLCRAALELIEDTPVGNGTGRYGWWSSMWEARVGRLATKAAGRLGELVRLGVIDLEVGRWGIEAARLTAGRDEELHRVAMVLEAWAGNDERVEREWEVVCAQAERFEAGSVPSPATESLFIAARTRKLH